MDFEIKDLLSELGGSAALIFAAWIFLSYLQQRYVAAFERYRALVNNFRDANDRGSERSDALQRQIFMYKRRCLLMRSATNIGVVSAILLISTLLAGAIDLAWPGHGVLKTIAIGCVTVGLFLVAVSAAIVVAENNLLRHALDEELSDIPEIRP